MGSFCTQRLLKLRRWALRLRVWTLEMVGWQPPLILPLPSASPLVQPEVGTHGGTSVRQGWHRSERELAGRARRSLLFGA